MFTHAFRSLALALLCAGINSTPANGQVNPKLSLTLAASWSEIQPFDPVAIRITLTNNSVEPMLVPRDLGAEFNTIRFEACGPNSVGYSRIVAVRQGVSDGLGAQKIAVKPGDRWITWDLVVPGEKAFFDAPGKWRIHASLAGDDAPAVTSNTVEIAVLGLFSDRQTETKAARQLIHQIIPGPIPTTASVQRLFDNQGDDKFKVVLGWLAAVTALRDAKTVEKFRTAQNNLGEMYSAADEISKLYIATLLANQYMAMSKWDLARETAYLLPEDSSPRFRLLYLLREKMRERPDPK